MSNRNKLENKVLRRDERRARPHPERRAISTIDLESSRDVLCEIPKHGASIGARGRRYLMRSRANLVIMPLTPAKLPAVRLAEKLATLTLTQVIRRRSQFAARAAGAKFKLEVLSPNSKFRPALQRVQDANLFALEQATAELEARRLHALGQLAGN